MRIPFLTLGLLAFVIGLLWIGQGTGLVAWPRSSFMISQMQWAWYGAGLAVVGLGLMWLARR
ncbi:putative membrane protein [Nitrobacteraceae bacterium AZCC 2161]